MTSAYLSDQISHPSSHASSSRSSLRPSLVLPLSVLSPVRPMPYQLELSLNVTHSNTLPWMPKLKYLLPFLLLCPHLDLLLLIMYSFIHNWIDSLISSCLRHSTLPCLVLELQESGDLICLLPTGPQYLEEVSSIEDRQQVCVELL